MSDNIFTGPVQTTTTNPPCPCGKISLPIGSKYHPSGLYLRLGYDNKYTDLKLTHNQPAILLNGQTFITTTEKIILDDSNPINIQNLSLFTPTTNLYIDDQIQIITRIYSSKETISSKYVNSLGDRQSFDIFLLNLVDNCENNLVFDLLNDRIQIEIYSLCDFVNEDCCEFSTDGWDITLSNKVNSLSTFCCPTTTTTTTTTTTLPPTTTTTTTTTLRPTTTTTTTTTQQPCCNYVTIKIKTYADANTVTVYDLSNNVIATTGPVVTGNGYATITLTNINYSFKVCVDNNPSYCYQFNCIP